MRRIFVILLILVFSCKSDTDFEKPNDLIPKEQMIDILVDLHLANGATSVNTIKNKKSNRYVFLVYDKYGIDSLRFFNSNRYYASRVDEYYSIFNAVRERLLKLEETYEPLAKNDSLKDWKRDSIKRAKRRRVKQHMIEKIN